jgi:predicted nucleic acid-binding protein
MGVILDSSVLIAGERRRDTVRETLKRVRTVHGEIDCALSVVTIVELIHGIYRARSDAHRDADERSLKNSAATL